MLILGGHIVFLLYAIVRIYLIRTSKDDDNIRYYEIIRGKVLSELGIVYTVMLVVTFVITLLIF